MSSPTVIFLCFILSTTVALVATPLVRRLAHRRNWMDRPGEWRKIHRRATPNVGGLAIAAGFNAGLLFLWLTGHAGGPASSVSFLSLWTGSLIITATGFYDDVRGLGYRKKFLVQVLIAYLMVWAGFRLDVSGLFGLELSVYHQSLLSLPLTVLWFVGVINAINLVDGLDGLAAGATIIALVSLSLAFSVQANAVSAGLMLAVAGATLGFLVYNLHPASIFMGDSGSMLLGFLIAAFAVQGVGDGPSGHLVLSPICALGFPLLDTLLAFFRRLARGASPFRPDQDHIHHRLLRKTGSQRVTVLLIHLMCLGYGGFAVLVAQGRPMLSVSCLALALLLTGLLLRALGYLRAPVPATTGPNGRKPLLVRELRPRPIPVNLNGYPVKLDSDPNLPIESA